VTNAWASDSRVVIVAGKGGVGSSTTAAALAIMAARQGADVLLIAVDGKPGLGPLLGGHPLTHNEQVLRRAAGGGQVRGRTIPPSQAFGDYLDLRGVGGLVRRAASAASLDVVAAATPGLEHLLVLGKIKELERTGAADLIVVDAPPAGHAAPFLRSASALRAAVGSGPVRDQADEVSEMLADRARTQALLVTLPEETPVNEVVELAYDIEEALGIALAPVVVNCCWPDTASLNITATAAARAAGITLSAADRRTLDASNKFGFARLEMQREQIARLTTALPIASIHLPRLPTPRLRPEHLDLLADSLAVTPMRAVPAR
jgi:arsenite/tail-anchored protein-transporting ATPase